MKMFISPSRIYLHRQFVDFRKSINGLSVIIDSELDLAVMSGDLSVFSRCSTLNIPTIMQVISNKIE
jgi:hypothetical protein